MLTEKQVEEFKEMLKNSKYVYTILRHCSKSGMKRIISVYIIINSEHYSLDFNIEQLKIAKRDKDGKGLIVKGCGMDMGFWLVNNIFAKMFGYDYNWQEKHKHQWL